MKKKIMTAAAGLSSIVKKTRHNDILPFSEIPSDNQFRADPASASRDLAASDLFSLFTADIIRKDVKFTR